MPGNPNYDAILSTTLSNYRDKFADNLSQSFFLLYWLTGKGRKRTEKGGESIIEQLMYGLNTTVRSYDGYETLDTTPQEGLTAAKYPWKQVAATISISGKEERQNSGEEKIISLLESKVMQSEISMRNEMNRMFFGDGTGNSSKDLFGLQLLVEDGTAWGTLAGIDRSLASNAWWRNQFIGTVGSFATNGIDKMRTLYNSASRGNDHPDFGVTDQNTFEYYEKVLQPLERFLDKKTGDAGFENLKFKGMVFGFDEQCTAGYLWMLNSKWISWVVNSDADLKETPFVTPENQDARVAKILLMANLVVNYSAGLGLMNGITA